jgi:hypothetical protein
LKIVYLSTSQTVESEIASVFFISCGNQDKKLWSYNE